MNERSYTLPAGALVRDALRAAVPELIPACESGEAFVTDGRGLPVALEDSLESGAILRAARSSRRPPGGVEADAGT
ncbi:MAG TPA: hypothetical protein VH879_03430 [Gemmatimonadales bacterium]